MSIEWQNQLPTELSIMLQKVLPATGKVTVTAYKEESCSCSSSCSIPDVCPLESKLMVSISTKTWNCSSWFFLSNWILDAFVEKHCFEHFN